jgi:hypothetical protein
MNKGGAMHRTILLTLACALAVTAAASAGSAAPDPVKLALQRLDMPAKLLPSAGASRVDPEDLAGLGVSGLKAADYTYSWAPPGGGAVGGIHKGWILFGYVFVAPSSAGAEKLYQHATKLRYGLPLGGAPLLYPTRNPVQLSLPRYGDEQLGIVGGGDNDVDATLYVRKGAVVWGLSIAYSPDAWKVTKADVLAQLKLYAHKQASRVGAG